MNATEHAVGALLAAVESRDLRLIHDALAPSATWQNVPHEVVTGRPSVLALLAGVVTWSERVTWDVVAANYDGDIGWIERVDRFWIGGHEHAARCNGVFRVDPALGVVTEVRDYVDLGEWRARIEPILDELASRPPTSVVERHLGAVRRLDTVAMAADYALDAELRRDGSAHRGWRAIADYFDTVPQRLGRRTLEFGATTFDERVVTVPWTIRSDDTVVATGTDDFEVRAGRIARQTVHLDTADF